MKRIRSSPARTAMQLLCFLLGLILAAMIAATMYVYPYMSPHKPDFLSGGGAAEAFSSLLNLGHNEKQECVTILLIGQDHREDEPGNRSDSMILCSFTPGGSRVILTSVLRDLYVPIPGHGSNRINAAYAFGGAPLLKQTMEDNFAVPIAGTVEVDFGSFSQIIDLLGGVQLELRQDEAQLISRETGTSVEAGQQTLNGQQALCYSRIRKLDADGDFSRTGRQRKVLQSIADAYRGASLTTSLKVLVKILPMITTDIPQKQLLGYAMDLLPRLGDLELVSQYVPAPGQGRDQTIDGMSVLTADMEAVREYLRKTLTQ